MHSALAEPHLMLCGLDKKKKSEESFYAFVFLCFIAEQRVRVKQISHYRFSELNHAKRRCSSFVTYLLETSTSWSNMLTLVLIRVLTIRLIYHYFHGSLQSIKIETSAHN